MNDAVEKTEEHFEREWNNTMSRIPEIIINGRSTLNYENLKTLCKGFYMAGARCGLELSSKMWNENEKS